MQIFGRKPEIMFKIMIKIKTIALLVVLSSMICISGAARARAAEPAVIYARDFGAVADGHTDSTSAIQNAIASAISSDKPTEIMMDAGEYRLNAPTSQSSALLLTSARNITITGVKGKTFLVIENPSIGTFLLDGCENVIIRNIIIDYDPLPFTQGSIVAIDRVKGTVDIDIDDGYGLPDAPFFGKAELRVGIKANLKGDETEYALYSIIAQSATLVRDRIYRIKKTSSSTIGAFGSDTINIGDRMIYEALRYAPQAGVCAWRSKNITITDITVYAGPSAATMWGVNDNIHINGLTVAIKPGSGRLVATNADAIHSFGTRNGMLIENCDISGNADDAINIHSRSGIIMELLSSTKLKINTGGCSDYKPGDMLQILRRGKILTTVKVVSVVAEPYIQTVTIDKPVADIRTGTSTADSDNIINLSACGQGSVIRNNVFGIHSGRDILVSSHDVLIENNTFRNPDGWSVSLSYDANYGEGPPAYNVTIKGNTFRGAGRSRMANINLCSIAPWSGGPVQGERPLKNIVIENNNFINPRNSIIYANGVDGLSIKNNKATTEVQTKTYIFPVILLENSIRISISDLTVEDPNPKSSMAVYIKDTVAPGLTGVTIGNIVMKTVSFFKKVVDDRQSFTSGSSNEWSRNSSASSGSKPGSGNSSLDASGPSISGGDSISSSSTGQASGAESQSGPAISEQSADQSGISESNDPADSESGTGAPDNNTKPGTGFLIALIVIVIAIVLVTAAVFILRKNFFVKNK
ncbi:MAG: glycosyl hydrolase family 28-related protein [Saccharofermentanales bacterium]